MAAAQAVKVDALVELGRYDEATEAAAQLLAIRVDLASLARVSYLRELHGNVEGAIAAMRQAAESPALAPENTAYVRTLLGNLLVQAGRPDEARPPTSRPSTRRPTTLPRSPGWGASRSAAATSTRPSGASRRPRRSCRCRST